MKSSDPFGIFFAVFECASVISLMWETPKSTSLSVASTLPSKSRCMYDSSSESPLWLSPLRERGVRDTRPKKEFPRLRDVCPLTTGGDTGGDALGNADCGCLSASVPSAAMSSTTISGSATAGGCGPVSRFEMSSTGFVMNDAIDVVLVLNRSCSAELLLEFSSAWLSLENSTILSPAALAISAMLSDPPRNLLGITDEIESFALLSSALDHGGGSRKTRFSGLMSRCMMLLP
mmetsp:Transcript_39673/g.87102  ORF Transcript_39673/g.87102 Transcript_39673/m.87102 type:complete len:233 (-) Transcript_39673:974-1672(-)